jgi:hypothetical protein
MSILTESSSEFQQCMMNAVIKYPQRRMCLNSVQVGSVKTIKESEISGSHGGEYEDLCLLGSCSL